jgi:hypothetical protein
MPGGIFNIREPRHINDHRTAARERDQWIQCRPKYGERDTNDQLSCNRIDERHNAWDGYRAEHVYGVIEGGKHWMWQHNVEVRFSLVMPVHTKRYGEPKNNCEHGFSSWNLECGFLWRLNDSE